MSWKYLFEKKVILARLQNGDATCCDTGQNDTIGKIELVPSSVLSRRSTNYKNDIQWFPSLFDEHRVNGEHLQV